MDSDTIVGTVTRVHGGHYYVRVNDAEIDCKMRGRIKKDKSDVQLVAIGDRVEIRQNELEGAVIEDILPRKSALLRQAPPPRSFRPDQIRYGKVEEKAQVIVANPDQVIIVFSLLDPEPNPLMLDRYLVACEAAQLPIVIVANKVDIVDESQPDLMTLYEEIGYRVIRTSAMTGKGLGELYEALRGKLSVLTGPSGVGKSSVMNALWPHLDLKTGEISDVHGKGRHTTVVAELFYLEDNTFVADTPGLRTFRLWDIQPEELDALFPEMLPFRDKCQFQPCSHLHEPNCAVQAAVDEGLVSDIRYESYCRMYEHGF